MERDLIMNRNNVVTCSFAMPNADTIEAIAEVEAMKKDPHKKTYSSFAEIIAEANKEMGE